MAGTGTRERRTKATVLAVAAAGVLLLAGRESALAGGSYGVGGEADTFALSIAQEQAGATDGDVAPRFTLGSKLGIVPDRTARFGGKIGVQGGDN